MLRPLVYENLEWVRLERNRPECRQYFRQPYLLTPSDQDKWFEQVKNREYIPFIVEYDLNRIGVVQLSHIDNIARKCEFSIMIVPEFRHRGFGKIALWELLKYAFNDLNMNQVYSDVFETNCALDYYLKWGFKSYAILPNWYYKDGQYIDSILISITKDEYINSLKQTVSESSSN